MSACVNAIVSTAANVREEADFAARVAETQRRVFQIALSVLRNPADAEEVAQEAYLQAYRRFSSLRDPARFRAWVCRIAFRLALNRLRAHRRRLARDTAWHGFHSDALADGARDAHNRLYLERLRAEIERLPEKLRAVLLLSTVEDMDAAEIAAVLEIPTGTVRSRLHLARKRLLEALPAARQGMNP
ncbi:MAG: RNA polymerase sigma factor [Candidatus Acidiferrales bacterium]